MKMKKYISVALLALLTLTISSCTKEFDVAGIEPKLPKLQLSSLGYQQNGPFSTATILQLNFGATASFTEVGAFKLEVFSGTTIASGAIPVKTVNFTSWSGKDDTSTPTVTNHTISFVLEPTSYASTNVYGGTILLKLSSLGLTAATTYSVRITGYSKDGVVPPSVYTQLAFFKTL
jgi:hypothetical protein